MGLLPLPSHVHYELLLQLLERQTRPSLEPGSAHYVQVQSVIVNLRKALSCQKQLEENCNNLGIKVDYRWSLNDSNQSVLPDLVAQANPNESTPDQS
jgi:Family of unknown function (DUF5340)